MQYDCAGVCLADWCYVFGTSRVQQGQYLALWYKYTLPSNMQCIVDILEVIKSSILKTYCKRLCRTQMICCCIHHVKINNKNC